MTVWRYPNLRENLRIALQLDGHLRDTGPRNLGAGSRTSGVPTFDVGTKGRKLTNAADGTDYITLPAFKSVVDLSRGWTLSTHFLLGLGTWEPVIWFRDFEGGGDTEHIGLMERGGSTNRLSVYNNNVKQDFTSALIDLTAYNHVVITCDAAGDISWWANGAFKETLSSATAPSSAATLDANYIGFGYIDDSVAPSLQISFAYLWNRVLGENEIRTIFREPYAADAVWIPPALMGVSAGAPAEEEVICQDVIVTVANGEATLTWTDPTDAGLSSISVERADTPGGTYSEVGTANPTDETYTDSTVSRNQQYYYRLVATVSAVEQDPSVEVMADTTCPYIMTPSADASEDPEVTLSWYEPADTGLASVRIERGTVSGGPYTEVDTIAAGIGSYVDTLTANDTYYYVFIAIYDDVGASESVNSLEVPVTVSGVGEVGVPNTVVATSNPNSIDLTWADPTSGDLDFINVYRGFETGGPYVNIASVDEGLKAYSDTNVKAGTTYYYVLTSVADDESESAQSSEVSGSPTGVGYAGLGPRRARRPGNSFLRIG